MQSTSVSQAIGAVGPPPPPNSSLSHTNYRRVVLNYPGFDVLRRWLFVVKSVINHFQRPELFIDF